jgi:carbonic anhydrase
MLLRPHEYGAGLFDYSCHGNNWDISDEVLGRQSPIDVHSKECHYEPRFKVDFKYKEFEALQGL